MFLITEIILPVIIGISLILSIIYVTKYGEFSKSYFRLFVFSTICLFFYVSILEMTITTLTKVYWLIDIIGGIYIIITTKTDTETKKLLKINYVKLIIWMCILAVIIVDLLINNSTLLNY